MSPGKWWPSCFGLNVLKTEVIHINLHPPKQEKLPPMPTLDELTSSCQLPYGYVYYNKQEIHVTANPHQNIQNHENMQVKFIIMHNLFTKYEKQFYNF